MIPFLLASVIFLNCTQDVWAAPARRRPQPQRPRVVQAPQKPKPKPKPTAPAPYIKTEPVWNLEVPAPKPVVVVVEPDLSKLKNDKEALISVFGDREVKDILRRYPSPEERAKFSQIFLTTMRDFLRQNKSQCDFDFVARLEKNLLSENISKSPKLMADALKILRIENSIDDVLYEVLNASTLDHLALRELNTNGTPKSSPRTSDTLAENNKLSEIYANFESFPDDTKLCALQEFIYLKGQIVDESGKKPKEPLKLMGSLNRRALDQNLIGLESFHKLEYLRTKSQLGKRYIFLRDYLKIIFHAKNQMVPKKAVYRPIKLQDEDKFSSERVKRFSRLTRRKILYRKYNETQIIMLAKVLQKASRRMGTDVETTTGAPYIMQEFKYLEEGKERTYVERFDLDPQSQFNLARRLLRKDILDLQMMDLFNDLTITHQDVVMAAFETGYISVEDINYVVRYDDLWNPETSRFERVSGFVFRVSGYATFFLPPPWNVIGTLALGVVEGLVDQKSKTGAENDNAATFIE
jgi:hypothetical protein